MLYFLDYAFERVNQLSHQHRLKRELFVSVTSWTSPEVALIIETLLAEDVLARKYKHHVSRYSATKATLEVPVKDVFDLADLRHQLVGPSSIAGQCFSTSVDYVEVISAM